MVYEDDYVLDFCVSSDFAFEGLQDNCNGRKVIKFWEGQVSLQAGHGWECGFSHKCQGRLVSGRGPEKRELPSFVLDGVLIFKSTFVLPHTIST